MKKVPGEFLEAGEIAGETPDSGKVAQLRGDASRLKPRAKGLLDKVEFAGNIEPILDRRHVVKSVLYMGGISLFYGPSNVGKSFLALWIADAVEKGVMCFGKRVRKGRVLVISAEGGTTTRNRVAAFENPSFWYLSLAITMTGKDSAAQALAEVAQHLAAMGGQISLIIIDTMSRAMGGADENAAPDIANFVANLGLLVRATGAHIMVIHHTGKDVTKGARGHSALRAAIDTEVELSRDNETGLITAEVTKQRDAPTGAKFVYRLRQVELGTDSDGDAVTTCIVQPISPAEGGRATLSETAARALKILSGLLAESGEVHRAAAYPGTPAVPVDAWREACLAEGAVSAASDRDSRARAFRRVRADLEEMRLVLVRDDLVWEVQQ